MKRILLAATLAIAACSSSLAETMTLGSTSYTVQRNVTQLAKGVTYTELLFPDRTYTGYTGGSRVHVVEADLTEPTVKLEMINTGLSGTRTLAAHAASVAKTNYTPVAGANANFWITSEQPWKSQSSGMPHGVSIRNGSMFTDPNTHTDPHCGGPTITGMLLVDNNGKVYIDRTVSQQQWNGAGSGVEFQIIHIATGHELDLDKCNRPVVAGTASIYNRNYGTSKAFKTVNTTSSNTWEIVSGVATELILDLAPGESWNLGGKTKFVIVDKRVNAGGGTLGDHDLAVVGRDSYASVMASGYNIGDEVYLNTRINFESLGSPSGIAQAISGNILAMKDGQKATFTSYDTGANERTLYATDATGKKLWIIVCEHNVAKTKKYFGFSTSLLCDIAKSFGATNAMQVDCGGSAQMYAGSKQVSQSYDQNGIRQVHNGLFVISTDNSSPVNPNPGTTFTKGPSSYKMNLAYTDTPIEQLDGLKIKRVIADGDYLYILAHDTALNPTVVVYDHQNNKLVRTLGTSNCVVADASSGGSTVSRLSDIALTSDGYLVGLGHTAGFANGKDQLYTYKWAKASDGTPTGECNHWNVCGINGNWSTNNTGETMAFSGSTTDGRMYYTSRSNTGSNYRFVSQKINAQSQISGTETYYNLHSPSATTASAPAPMMFASPFDNENFILNGSAMPATEIKFVMSARGQAAEVATCTVLPNTLSHTDVFMHDGHAYMTGAATNGIILADISEGLSSASAVTIDADALTAASADNAAVAGTTADKHLVLCIVRDGKVSKYTTKMPTVDPDPIDPDQPTGDRAHMAYKLGMTGDRANGYQLSYSLTGDVKSATVNLINKSDNSVLSFDGGTAKGVNTVSIKPKDLETDAQYNWEVEVHSLPVATSTHYFHAAPAKLDSRGGVGIVTNPESDAYGRIIVSNGYAQGMDLYEADMTKVGNYGAGMAPLVASNRSDTYRIGMRDGMIAYASAYSDKGAGFWRLDPAAPSNTLDNLCGGTNDGTGCFKIGETVTGTGSSAVAFTGSGANTRLWTFAEDWPSGNSAYKGIISRWDIGTADKITTGVNAAYDQLAGNKLIGNQNANITPYGEGIFISQKRGNGGNSTGTPALIYVNIYGEVLYNSGGDADIPGSGAGMAISADGSLIALSSCKGDDIRLFNVTWDGMKPTLTYAGQVPNSANTDNQYETAQLAFDPAGNLYGYYRGTSADVNGLHAFSLVNAKPQATTPAKSSFIVLGPDKTTGVENISVDSPDNDITSAKVEWFTLSGVRVNPDNLRPGIYIRRQGKTSTKVLIK